MQRDRLTLSRITRFACPEGAKQAFLWDTEAPRLAVRATAGAKSFIFESKLDRRTVRVTIGSTDAWTIDDARAEARRLQTLIDQGIDPREEKRERIAASEAKRAESKRAAVTFGEAWRAYIEARGGEWGEKYREHHVYAIQAKPTPQPLAGFVGMRLGEFTAEKVAAWLAKEKAKRPTAAAGAFRKLRAFGNWCAESEDYAGLFDPGIFAAKKVTKAVPKSKAKDGSLQREQLAAWFEAVRKEAPTQAAYLQALLLTGARRGELAGLRWADVDFRWCSLRIRDKVEGERTIPLTPYVAALLRDLQRRNQTPPGVYRIVRGKRIANDLKHWKPSEWVFSGRGGSGRITRPNHAHDAALSAAGLPHLTLHDLRRSFGSLAEWADMPVGVVAQIMGHKPSATAEKHYRVRPLDLLRKWHAELEAWILAEAGIEQPQQEEAAPLRAVASEKSA
ncbi:tyrosine-type recombinase/integrase [Thauera sp. JM12B12]|uniref:tyrosine-type recombinase/integrase n=1 Tax=Thauera sp. JM12B12 TaxID=3142262 RepID=UPI0031F3B001